MYKRINPNKFKKKKKMPKCLKMHIRTWHHSNTEHIFFNFPIFVDPIVDYTRFFFSFFFFSPFLKLENENQQGLCIVGFGGASQKKNEPKLGFPALR